MAAWVVSLNFMSNFSIFNLQIFQYNYFQLAVFIIILQKLVNAYYFIIISNIWIKLKNIY